MKLVQILNLNFIKIDLSSTVTRGGSCGAMNVDGEKRQPGVGPRLTRPALVIAHPKTGMDPAPLTI
jgi:hypothetical protein